jgi:hypothetical protein
MNFYVFIPLQCNDLDALGRNKVDFFLLNYHMIYRTLS